MMMAVHREVKDRRQNWQQDHVLQWGAQWHCHLDTLSLPPTGRSAEGLWRAKITSVCRTPSENHLVRVQKHMPNAPETDTGRAVGAGYYYLDSCNIPASEYQGTVTGLAPRSQCREHTKLAEWFGMRTIWGPPILALRGSSDWADCSSTDDQWMQALCKTMQDSSHNDLIFKA